MFRVGEHMVDAKKMYYEKRAISLVNNLKSRHFDAYYCSTREAALEKALELIPQGSTVGWSGATSARQIGLTDALKNGNYRTIDREVSATPEDKEAAARASFDADVFLTGANALSLDGQMVNIDGTGNRTAAILYGPETVLVIAGMNKVVDTLEEAMRRARTVAAPINQQRFLKENPCAVTGVCADCKLSSCSCNQIVITRHCRPSGRIKFVLVGEELGF